MVPKLYISTFIGLCYNHWCCIALTMLLSHGVYIRQMTENGPWGNLWEMVGQCWADKLEQYIWTQTDCPQNTFAPVQNTNTNCSENIQISKQLDQKVLCLPFRPPIPLFSENHMRIEEDKLYPGYLENRSIDISSCLRSGSVLERR